MRLQDKVAIITGGGVKIGKAYALALVREGAKVCLPDLVDAQPVVGAVHEIGGEAMTVQCDVSDESSVQQMVEATVKRFGGIDILVNNAAYFMTVWKGPFWEMSVDEWDKAMAVNVRGTWLCAKEAFPYMMERGRGKIINISSGVALNGTANYAHYVTSKGAVIALTRAMARELGPYNINVNAIAPGFVVTEGRDVTPQQIQRSNEGRVLKRTQVEGDLVGTLVFLASSDSDFMTGQLLAVDGGSNFLG
jgi:NAD(P)-dependent dehydrogenase (short-subunit alcohol dehydrogenase family)